jgi:hypothetical protein
MGLKEYAIHLLDCRNGAESKIAQVLDLITQYGGIDGGHHKQWVLDRIVRILTDTKEKYEDWVEEYQDGEDGPHTYEWDTGIAP